MEKYKPEKDLPEDIKRLPHGETVCRFCGVSYLVHHEIKRLEEAVESMQGQLKRLRELESQKVSWETERGSLNESLVKKEEQAAETLSTLQSVRSELSAVTLRCVQLETQLQEEHKKLQEAKEREVHVLSSLKSMQAAVWQLKRFRGHVEELVMSATSQVASVRSRLLQECLCREERQAQDHTQLKSTIAELQEVLELERKRHSELKVETETSKRELLEQVTRSGATQRELEVMLAAAESRVKSIGVDAERKDQKIDALTKQVRLLNSRVREVEGEGKRLCEERDKQIRNLQTRLKETDDQLSSKETTLRGKEEQLRKMEETVTAEKQTLERMLSKAEEGEVRARREMKALKRDHSESTEQLKSEHQEVLTRLRKSLTEEHAKELQAAENRHRAVHTKEQGRLTELRSSLAVAELEHKRVVHELHMQLQKEKSMLERELSRHLDQVKDLELRLTCEQREREETMSHMTIVHSESKRQLEKKYTELETKLSSAYQEISALQAVVQRECEEREELLQALAELKAQRTPASHQRLEYRQTK